MQARRQIDIKEALKLNLLKTQVPTGKRVLQIKNLGFQYPNSKEALFKQFNFELQGPNRMALHGPNGSGKTTLLKLIMGELTPSQGSVTHGVETVAYLDQHASVLDPKKTILENYQRLNPKATQNESHSVLAQFLFRNVQAMKPVEQLSGGEKIRAALACVLGAVHPPQLLILDEPTNHLDLHSIECIEQALQAYQGAMLVISHDKVFLENLGIQASIRIS